jgi:DNA-binding LacI/PurR family transcriptional regulator
MTARRITQKDIAHHAGVTQATVSLALRNHPSVSAEVRDRIVALAEKLGYRPDPMLSSLVAYRSSLQSASFQGVLAWVTNYPTRSGWSNGQQVGYFRGARKRAEELGYKLEETWLGEYHSNQERFTQVLLARGIQGLLLAPQAQPRTTIELDWRHFSAVTFGYTLQSPRLHMVMNHQFRNMTHLLHELHARGYRRVGIAMPTSQDERAENSYLASYLVEQLKQPRRDRIPQFVRARIDRGDFIKWVARYEPEVVVTGLSLATRLREWLTAEKWKVPDQIGLALPNIPFKGDFYAGIDENPLLVGATGVDALVGMMHRNERGVPGNARYILIEGDWFEGHSLPR